MLIYVYIFNRLCDITAHIKRTIYIYIYSCYNYVFLFEIIYICLFKYQATPFHIACENGHVNIVDMLLTRGANMEANADVRNVYCIFNRLCDLTVYV